jgi:hypothetical protein
MHHVRVSAVFSSSLLSIAATRIWQQHRILQISMQLSLVLHYWVRPSCELSGPPPYSRAAQIEILHCSVTARNDCQKYHHRSKDTRQACRVTIPLEWHATPWPWPRSCSTPFWAWCAQCRERGLRVADPVAGCACNVQAAFCPSVQPKPYAPIKQRWVQHLPAVLKGCLLLPVAGPVAGLVPQARRRAGRGPDSERAARPALLCVGH